MTWCFCLEALGDGTVVVSDGKTGALVTVLTPGERTNVQGVRFGLTSNGIFSMSADAASAQKQE